VKTMTNNEPSCFAIVPFKAPFSDYYKNIYQPAIATAGLKPIRGDDFTTITPVMDDIWESIVNCQICVADLSQNNPNVMFEVGLAMAIDKPIVFMTQALSELPFDLKTNRVIEYHPSPDPKWEERLKQTLTATIQNLVQQKVEVLRPTWKTVKTDAETIYDKWKQHGKERANLVDITDHLQPAYADEFFVTASEAEDNLIKRAKSELWLIYETGSLILQKNFGSILDFLKAGGHVRILLVSQKIHETVIFRHRFQKPTYLPDRYAATHTYLNQIADEIELEPDSSRFSVRWLLFPVNFVGVFIEPTAIDKHESYAAIRMIGFRTFIERERAMVMRRDISQNTFDHYREQFNQMWEAASPEA
jgi:hypothetical protein